MGPSPGQIIICRAQDMRKNNNSSDSVDNSLLGLLFSPLKERRSLQTNSVYYLKIPGSERDL